MLCIEHSVNTCNTAFNSYVLRALQPLPQPPFDSNSPVMSQRSLAYRKVAPDQHKQQVGLAAPRLLLESIGNWLCQSAHSTKCQFELYAFISIQL